MTTPEINNNPESLRQLAVSKIQGLLDTKRSQDLFYPNYRWREGASWAQGLARATLGRRYERFGSVPLGVGYSWVGIIEDGSEKNGKLKPHEIIIFGEQMLDGEGRYIQRLWQLNLLKKKHHTRKYELLNELLDVPESERAEIFSKLADYERDNP